MTATVQVVEEHGVDELLPLPGFRLRSVCLLLSSLGLVSLCFLTFSPFILVNYVFLFLPHFMNVVAFLTLHFAGLFKLIHKN